MEAQGKITNIKELLEVVEVINTKFQGQVWWRGQRNIDWSLRPSVFRDHQRTKSESSFISRFRSKAPSRHPKVPDLEDKASWLFLMQHYRLPTRLLDWSESPLIACYFAIEEDQSFIEHPDLIHDSDGAIYALSPYELNRRQTGTRVMLLPDGTKAKSLIDGAFGSNHKYKHEVLAIRPAEVDLRLTMQMSVFTIHAPNIDIEDLQDAWSFLVKYSIPASSKVRILKQLKDLGIRESSLFPDLEHLAKDVATAKFKRLKEEIDTDNEFIEKPAPDNKDFSNTELST